MSSEESYGRQMHDIKISSRADRDTVLKTHTAMRASYKKIRNSVSNEPFLSLIED